VILSITSMLVSPNLDSPANVDAAKLLKENLK
jgi:ubiquitin-protein ligase